MAIQRFAVDGINGDDNNTGQSSGVGDFTNAVATIEEAWAKATTYCASNTQDTVFFELSGGTEGIVYRPTKNLVFHDNYFPRQVDTAGAYGVVGSEATNHNGEVTIDASAISDYQSGASSTIIGGNRRGLVIERLNIVNTPSNKNTIYLVSITNTAIRGCTFQQGKYGIFLKNTENAEITDNFITGNVYTNTHSAIRIDQNISPYPDTYVVIANNYIWKAGSPNGTGRARCAIELHSAPYCEVYHNTIVDAQDTGIGLTYGSTNCTVKNNIITNSIDTSTGAHVQGVDIGVDTASASGSVIDYNTCATSRLYFGGGWANGQGWYSGTLYTTLSDWQTATGYDANSITDTPIFVGGTSPSTIEGIALGPNSPQVDEGISISSSLVNTLGINLNTGILNSLYADPPAMGASAEVTTTRPTITVGTKVTAYTGTANNVGAGSVRTTALRTNNRIGTVLVNTTGNEVFTAIKTRGVSSGGEGTIKAWLYACEDERLTGGGPRWKPTDRLVGTQQATFPSSTAGESEITLTFATPYTPPAGINICLAVENLEATKVFVITTDNDDETGTVESRQDNTGANDPWPYSSDVTRSHASVIWLEYTPYSEAKAVSKYPYATVRQLVQTTTSPVVRAIIAHE